MSFVVDSKTWIITRKYVARSLYKCMSKISPKKISVVQANKIIELIAKDLNVKPKEIKDFLLMDKIVDEYSLEDDRLMEKE